MDWYAFLTSASNSVWSTLDKDNDMCHLPRMVNKINSKQLVQMINRSDVSPNGGTYETTLLVSLSLYYNQFNK